MSDDRTPNPADQQLPDFSNRDLDETIAPEDDTTADIEVRTDLIPESLGRYKIQKLLGRGGMGSVYLAHDSQLDRLVALKVPKFDASANEKSIVRFYREARSAANLSHPNLCQVFDVGEIDGTHYIAMAFVKGRPLSDYISEDKQPNPRTAAGIIRKVALAMHEAHQSGIIHRDIKPANIMIDHRNEPIVMDFGLAVAQQSGNESRLTQDGALLGSPAYMSPEQLQGELDLIGPVSDVYALGVVLYELMAGKLPFDGSGSTIAMIGQILTKAPVDLLDLRPDLDADIVAVCRRAMAKSTDDRYSTMKELADDLGKYLKAGPSSGGTITPAETGKKTVTGAKTVTVSQIQITEKAKLAKTLCDSGQYAAAIPVLKQIIQDPNSQGSKALQFAQSALPKAEAENARGQAAAASPTPTHDPFANLPSSSGTPVTAYRPPAARNKKSKGRLQSNPAFLAGLGAAVMLVFVGIGYAVWPLVFNVNSGPIISQDPEDVVDADESLTDATQNEASTEPGPESNAADAGPSSSDGPLDDLRDRIADRFFSQQFDRFDPDGDGRIAIDDLPPPMRPPMSLADRNQDNVIDRAELDEARRRERNRRGGGGRGGFGNQRQNGPRNGPDGFGGPRGPGDGGSPPE